MGQNLLPLALRYPEAEFVGVDLSTEQIASARSSAVALGLKNARLLVGDITELVDELTGKFDYIICHGVYSWVSPDVQASILDCCQKRLARSGVAVVSFNALPGGSGLQRVRDLLALVCEGVTDPSEKINCARKFVTQVLGNASAILSAAQVDSLNAFSNGIDSYVLHEYFARFNESLDFSTFNLRLSRHGLRYLCDAELSVEGARQLIATKCGIAREQFGMESTESILDNLQETSFRRAVICRAEESVSEVWRAESILNMSVAGRFEIENMDEDCSPPGLLLRVGGQQLRLLLPVAIRVAREIQRAAPAYIPVSALCDGVDEKGSTVVSRTLIKLALSGAVDLVTEPLIQSGDTSPFPLAWLWTKHCIDQGSRMFCGTTHYPLLLTPAIRHVLQLMNGRSTLAEIEQRYHSVSGSLDQPSEATESAGDSRASQDNDTFARLTSLLVRAGAVF